MAGRQGQNNGTVHGLKCPFCGKEYSFGNLSLRDPPEGAEDVNPNDRSRGSVGWSPHTIACWKKQQAKKQGSGDHRIVIAVPTKKKADEVFDFVLNELGNVKISTVMTQQDAATTRLERAAPDLLAALQGLMESSHDVGGDCKCCMAARAAIAKAVA